MTTSLEAPDLATRQGDAAHVAYCGFCDEQCLYVCPLQQGWNHPARGDNGEILNLHPEPKGRWVDRGDGYYTELRTPPTDGQGRRAHRCKP